MKRKVLIGVGVATLSVTGVLVHLSVNGWHAESFDSPDGKMRLNAYRVPHGDDFKMAMPGDGGWHHYSFGLEIIGGTEIRRSKPVLTNLRVIPPEWDGECVRFPGDSGYETWSAGPP